MIVQPIDYLLVVWFALAAASTAYVAWDQFRNNPEPTVMRVAFILVTLYMGPLGLLIYVLADKEPRPGTHEQFTAPLWKQGVGSTIHCVAGDATGIILAAAVTATFGLPMWIDLIVEYASGFIFGLFIFQALFMRRIMGGSYWGQRPPDVPARVHEHERDDGWHGAGDELPHDGTRHAGDGADRAPVLGRDVARSHRRLRDRVSGEFVDGKAEAQARAHDRADARVSIRPYRRRRRARGTRLRTWTPWRRPAPQEGARTGRSRRWPPRHGERRNRPPT